jgi:hypothetical protein
MKTSPGVLNALLGAAALLSMSGSALASAGQSVGQSFAGAAPSGGAAGEPAIAGSLPSQTSSSTPAAADAQGSNQLAQGEQAMNQGRWADAARLFSAVAAQHGDHSDAALYWKAYAENKLSQPKLSLDACGELKSSYPKSRWIDDCEALEVEIFAWTGKHLQINANDSDDVKLLTINAMMRLDEPRALDEIAKILNGDSSQKLKHDALFILNEHHDAVTYDQIARISYTEGDVRVARGAKDADWEQARADLPLETGFTLSTGNGRAEIELENASTIYLAENSVLVFNELETVVGKPATKVALLTGTVTLHVRPFVSGELFDLRTPSDHIIVTYGQTANLRITSYMDATTMTALEDGVVQLRGFAGGVDLRVKPGATTVFHEGKPLDNPPAQDPATFAAWDKWVANRYSTRTQAIAEVMKASGLSEPIPGLADLANQGTFFDCAPYGTCWEPASFAESQTEAGEYAGASATRALSSPVPSSQIPQTAGTSSDRTTSPQASRKTAALGPNETVGTRVETNGFPCLPETVRYRVARNMNTGQERVIDTQPLASHEPWDFAVCHAGSWIRHNRHYAWVVGHRRHHHPPVMWVKSGKTVAIVPLHPHDVANHVPINHIHEVFAVNAHGNTLVQPVHLSADHPVEFLALPPKEFREGYLPPLAHADEPHPVGHVLRAEPLAKGSIARSAPIPFRFDSRTQSFTMSGKVLMNGKSVTVNVPVNNRSGDLQSHSGSGWSGGSPGGSLGGRGGGSSGGYRGSNSGYSGGGAHGGYSGGSSSSGGGGSHSSGGGGTSSSSSSSSVSSSSSTGSSSSSTSSGGSGGTHK